MYLYQLQNLSAKQKIAIIGLGVENFQFLQWLIEVINFDPQKIVIADEKEPSKEFRQGLEKWQIPLANIIIGTNYLQILDSDPQLQENNKPNWFADIEYIFKAPGIWSHKPELVFFRQIKGSDRVLSPLVFFMEKFRQQIIGVTGTKGKTTTSSLITHFLKAKLGQLSQQKQQQRAKASLLEQSLAAENLVHYCGNTTGISPYKYWTEKDQEVDLEEFFVIELSSFQLQDLGVSQISPKIAVITNYFVDHLDQHANKFEYWQAKSQLFLHQELDDFLVSGEQFLKQIDYLGDQIYRELGNAQIKNYFFDEPQNQEFIIINEIFAWLKQFYQTDLIGEHNWHNLIIALITTEIVLAMQKQRLGLDSGNSKISFYQILQNLIRTNQSLNQELINTFISVKHRLELIQTFLVEISKENFINQKDSNLQKNLENFTDSELTVKFWDDGAATEPDAVEACISALTENNQKLWLWITGIDKGSSLEKLSLKILEKIEQNKICKLTLCGQVGQNLLEKMKMVKPEIFNQLKTEEDFVIELYDTFRQALAGTDFERQIYNFNLISQDPERMKKYNSFFEMEDDNNLKNYVFNIALSPGGSSQDEFVNYKDRSQFWCQKVNSLEFGKSVDK